MPIVAPPIALARQFFGFYTQQLIPAFERLATEFPGSQYTSWYRDPVNNRRVGGNPRSQHLLAFAADVVPPPEVRFAFASRAQQLGFVVVDEGDHLHLQAFPPGSIPERFFL